MKGVCFVVNDLSKTLFTTNDIAQKLRVHQRTVQRWISSGQLQAIKVGPRVWRIEKEALDTFMTLNKLQ